MRLDLKVTERSGNDTIIAREVYKQFSDRPILESVNLKVKYSERVGLIGANGSGKSTFIKMLLGEVAVDRGELKLGAGVKVAYLPQEIKFKDEHLTTLEVFREGIDIAEGKAREYLAKFMFFGKRVFTVVSKLSGGERIRLKLAKLLYEEVNLLILDEPTNHLDIDSIETLEDALNNFDGTLFFISHDRYFINKISDRIVAIENKTFKSYEGDYDAYRVCKQKELEVRQMMESKAFKEDEDKKYAVKPSKPTTEPLKSDRHIEQLERKIQSLEHDLKEVENTMIISSSNYQNLETLALERERIMQQLELLWINLETCV